MSSALERWQIGFDLRGGNQVGEGGELAFGAVTGDYIGHSPQTCNGASSCGTAYYGTINTCGGGASAIRAARVTQKSGTNCGQYTSSYNQVHLAQCCPAGSGGQSTNWFAEKACPSTSNNSTQCGTRTKGACKACPTYPTNAGFGCNVMTNAQVGTCSGSVNYPVHFAYQAYCEPTCNGSASCGGPDGCGSTCTQFWEQGILWLCGPEF